MKRDSWSLFFFGLVVLAAGIFVFSPKAPYKFGLDISGGSTLTYQADLATVKPGEVTDVLTGVKDLIERRINVLGISEVAINYTNAGRIIVEIPGISDTNQAIQIIGETPLLDFRIPIETKLANGSSTTNFVPTILTGRYLKRAEIQFNQNALEPSIGLEFDKEGANIFEQLTRANIGKPMAIYLDGQPISAPVVREAITGGRAEISGRFTIAEAKMLVQRLNQGALPVPLTLVSQNAISPTLGASFLNLALRGGIIGALLVILFMLLYYRGLGVIASLALICYLIVNLALYKLLGVVLTLAGIAGLILSVGMAVDANILVFERTREERRRGVAVAEALSAGFQRAWTSIRDSNITTMLSAVIIYFSMTSFVKGFALTLGLGVLVSMLTAYTLSRLLIIKSHTFFERWPKLL